MRSYDEIFPIEPEEIWKEVKYFLPEVNRDLDMKQLEEGFWDVVKLFLGEFSGYKECNTPYHDLSHTLGVFLAVARLLHGASAASVHFDAETTNFILLAALFHDTGLIQDESDTEGTGAKYSVGHEARSIAFFRRYLMQKGWFSNRLFEAAQLIACTVLNLSPSDIPFASKQIELGGKFLGTADLLAQMADRLYLEKLLFLYQEFREGQVPGFVSEQDLLEKTEGFYGFVSKNRLKKDMGNVQSYMKTHFHKRFGENHDYYKENIEKNIVYLNKILSDQKDRYRSFLRRSYIPSESIEEQ